jgi:hypothetical protein
VGPAELRPVPDELHPAPADLRPVPDQVHAVPADLRPVPDELRPDLADLRPVPDQLHPGGLADLRPVPDQLHPGGLADLRPVPAELRPVPDEIRPVGPIIVQAPVCPDKEMYFHCGACDRSCSGVQPNCPKLCQEKGSCGCIAGHVREAKGPRCIPETECNFGGEFFEPYDVNNLSPGSEATIRLCVPFVHVHLLL